MKKFLLFLTCMLTLFGVAQAESYTFGSWGTISSGTPIESTDKNVSLTFNKSSGTSTPTNNSGLIRVYAKNTIVVKSKDGYKIDKITISVNGGDGYSSASSDPAGFNSSTGVWSTGNTAVSEVTITPRSNVTSGHIRVNTIEVVYSATGGGTGGGETTDPDPDDPEEPVTPPAEDNGEVTFDFTSYGFANAADVTTKTEGVINATFGKGTNTSNAPKYYTSGTSVRMYANNTLTISAPEGYTISSIEFTLGGTKTNSISPSTGSGEIGSNNTTWEPPTSAINSVTFTAGNSGQLYIQKIKVTYVAPGNTDPDSSKTEVTLSYADADKAQTVKWSEKDSFTAPTLTVTPEKAAEEVKYISDNPEVATVDDTTGEVTILFPGKATITASISDSETYQNASASYTINVEVDGVLDVATALDFIEKGFEGIAQVKGIITEITENSAQYKNATYSIADDAQGETLLVYRGKWLNGADFNDKGEIAVGGVITVEGKLFNYINNTNNTPEITDSQVVAYEAPAGGKEPAGLSFAEKEVTKDFEEGGSFTLTVTNPYELENIVYDSSNKDVAKVNETGFVSFVGIGKTEISAAFEGNEEYEAQTVSYTLILVDPNAGNGTEEKPYSVEELRNIDLSKEVSNIYVVGYIVGSLANGSKNNAIFGAEGAVNTNLIIADSADETSVDNCASIQLPNNDIRTALNLKDNPDNIGRKVMIGGTGKVYCSLNGINPSSSYKFLDEKKSPGLYFEEIAVRESVKKEEYTQEVKNPNNLSPIIYSIDPDDDSVLIDEEEGMVMFSQPGTYTITASFEGNNEYEAGEASYQLTVYDPDVLSYTIEFAKGSETQRKFSSSTDIKNVISKGADYIFNVDNGSNAYHTTKEGSRIGLTDGDGFLTFNLSEIGRVNATKIIVKAQGYDNESRLSLDTPIDSNNQETAGVAISTSDYADYEFKLDGSELTQLSLYGWHRVFVESITVEYKVVDDPNKLTTVITSDLFANPEADYADYTFYLPEDASEKDLDNIVFKANAKFDADAMHYRYTGSTSGIYVDKNYQYRVRTVAVEWDGQGTGGAANFYLISSENGFKEMKELYTGNRTAEFTKNANLVNVYNFDDDANVRYIGFRAASNVADIKKITIFWEKIDGPTPVSLTWNMIDDEDPIEGNEANVVYHKDAYWIDVNVEPEEAKDFITLELTEGDEEGSIISGLSAAFENVGKYVLTVTLKDDYQDKYVIDGKNTFTLNISQLPYTLEFLSDYEDADHATEFKSEKFDTRLLVLADVDDAIDYTKDLIVEVEPAVEFAKVDNPLEGMNDLGYEYSKGEIEDNELLLDITCSGLYKVTIKPGQNVVGQDYTFNVNVYPSITGLKLGDCEHDGQNMEYNFTYDENDPNMTITNAKATVSVPVYGAEVWYKLHVGTKAETQNVRRYANTDDNGYTLAEDNVVDLTPLIDTTGSSISFLLKKNGAETPLIIDEDNNNNKSVHTILITATNTPTGVGTVAADFDPEADYYTLQGVKVTNPERGIYICVKAGKAQKVVL